MHSNNTNDVDSFNNRSKMWKRNGCSRLPSTNRCKAELECFCPIIDLKEFPFSMLLEHGGHASGTDRNRWVLFQVSDKDTKKSLKVKYRDSLKGLYVVARIFFLLLLNCSDWVLNSCLAKHVQAFFFILCTLVCN